MFRELGLPMDLGAIVYQEDRVSGRILSILRYWAYKLPGQIAFSHCWRTSRLEAAIPTNNLLSLKLIEPPVNQQGKRVRIYRKYKLLIFVLTIQSLIG